MAVNRKKTSLQFTMSATIEGEVKVPSGPHSPEVAHYPGWHKITRKIQRRHTERLQSQTVICQPTNETLINYPPVCSDRQCRHSDIGATSKK